MLSASDWATVVSAGAGLDSASAVVCGIAVCAGSTGTPFTMGAGWGEAVAVLAACACAVSGAGGGV